MYQLPYDPGFTVYEMERRQAAGRNPTPARRTSPQTIREALVHEDLWRIIRRRTR